MVKNGVAPPRLQLEEAREGFTLIELMVVVAVIGILSILAIPNYQKFRARARQTEGKTLLATIFTAEKSFHGEYATYLADLPTIGFFREGFAYAGSYFQETSTPKARYAIYLADNSPIVNWANLGLAQWHASYNPYAGFLTTGSICYCPTAASSTGACDSFVSGGVGAVTTTSTFEARVIGCPLNNVTVFPYVGVDRWSITQDRVLVNLSSGL